MGILIKGMEMPKEVPIIFCIHPDGKVFADLEGGWREYKAVPVQPHGRLIDADALYESYALDTNIDVMASVKRINEYMQLKIDEAPTIIPAKEGE